MPRSLLLLLVGALAMAPSPVLAQGAQTEGAEERTVVIADGDTLWSLARRLLGDPQRWPELVEANRDLISGPGELEVGMRLVVPGAGDRPPPAVAAAPAPSAAEAGSPSASTPEPAPTPEPDSTSATVGVATLQPGDLRPAPDPTAPVPVRLAQPAAEARTAPAAEVRATPATERPRAAGPERTSLFRGAETEGRTAPQAEREATRAIPEGVHASAPFLTEGDAEAARDAASLAHTNPDGGVRSARRGDRLRLQGTGTGLTPGARLQAFRLSGTEVRGRAVAVPTGVLRVETVGVEIAVVVVEQSFDRMTPGDRVHRLEDAPAGPTSDVVPTAESLDARILAEAASDAMIGPGDWIFLDVGRAHGARPGDEFVPVEGDDLMRPGGRLQVVLVQDSTATARVVGVGDRLLRVGTALRLDRRLR